MRLWYRKQISIVFAYKVILYNRLIVCSGVVCVNVISRITVHHIKSNERNNVTDDALHHTDKKRRS